MGSWAKVCQHPSLAGHMWCGPVSASAKKNVELLRDELGEWESALG